MNAKGFFDKFAKLESIVLGDKSEFAVDNKSLE